MLLYLVVLMPAALLLGLVAHGWIFLACALLLIQGGLLSILWSAYRAMHPRETWQCVHHLVAMLFFPPAGVFACDRLVSDLTDDIHPLMDLEAVTRGGLTRLTAACMDVHRLALSDGCFDVVTMLEVLEHLANPPLAAREVVRVARRAVVVSVPSQPDDNPEHRHLFTAEHLERTFLDAGASRVTVDHVLNHRIAIIRK